MFSIMGTINTIEDVNAVTWVISDVMKGSHKVDASRKMGHQSVFTIGLQGRQNFITIGHQGHTKVIKGSHMSTKIA